MPRPSALPLAIWFVSVPAATSCGFGLGAGDGYAPRADSDQETRTPCGCGFKEICVELECVPVECTQRHHCDRYSVCHPQTHTCVPPPCTADKQCREGTGCIDGACLPLAGSCVTTTGCNPWSRAFGGTGCRASTKCTDVELGQPCSGDWHPSTCDARPPLPAIDDWTVTSTLPIHLDETVDLGWSVARSDQVRITQNEMLLYEGDAPQGVVTSLPVTGYTLFNIIADNAYGTRNRQLVLDSDAVRGLRIIDVEAEPAKVLVGDFVTFKWRLATAEREGTVELLDPNGEPLINGWGPPTFNDRSYRVQIGDSRTMGAPVARPYPVLLRVTSRDGIEEATFDLEVIGL